MAERRSLQACADEIGALIGTAACLCGRALPTHITPGVDFNGRSICTTCEAERLAARRERYVRTCPSFERFRAQHDERHDFACCKALPVYMAPPEHAGPCCTDRECDDCDPLLVEARAKAGTTPPLYGVD